MSSSSASQRPKHSLTKADCIGVLPSVEPERLLMRLLFDLEQMRHGHGSADFGSGP